MSSDTERLEAQVERLTKERDQAYHFLREAGKRARRLKAELAEARHG